MVDKPLYTQFLQWALPRLHMRWPGFRKVRTQVFKRIRGRLKELGIADIDAYRSYLQAHEEEWAMFDAFCRITISRFYRDRDTFDFLGSVVLPPLAEVAMTAGESEVRAWSAGCASGEEGYTLKMLWKHWVHPAATMLPLHIIATDVDPVMIARACRGCYTAGSFKDLPREWLDREFVRQGECYCVRDDLREGIDFRLEDIREIQPTGPFHVILCRYLVFTYFEPQLQARLLATMLDRLVAGGVLVTGKRETLPEGEWALRVFAPRIPIYRKLERANRAETSRQD